MKYRIIFSPWFEADIDAKVIWLREQGTPEDTINNWFAKLYRRVWATETMPRLFPVDRQYTAEVGRESHKIIFPDHMAIYQVNDDAHLIEFVAFHHGTTRK